MRIFQFIIIIVLAIVFPSILNAQSSIIVESEQLNKGSKCVFYRSVNGALTKGDTIAAKTQGRLELVSKTPFLQGQYFLETPKEVHDGLIEFLIEKNKSDEITISLESYNTVLFKDNPINGIYSAYLGSVRNTEDQIQKLCSKGTAANTSAAEIEKIKGQIKESQKKLHDLENSLINRYPDTLLSAIITANSLPSMPGSILDNYRIDPSAAIYKETTQFLRDNYWKGIDFKNDVLLNTVLLPSKTKKYISFFDKNDPELIITVKELLDKSAVNPVMYQIMSDALYDSFNATAYHNNNENIAISILKNAKEQTFVPDWKKQSIEQQILIHEKNKVGTKAANLVLKDTEDVKYALHDLKSKYTILFFYDPECSHCTEIMPKMKGWFYTDGPKDGEVAAIYISQNEQEWKEYVKENTYPPKWLNLWDKNGENKIQQKYWIQSLPTIYVLDENKNVVLKNSDFKELVNYFSRNKK